MEYLKVPFQSAGGFDSYCALHLKRRPEEAKDKAFTSPTNTSPDPGVAGPTYVPSASPLPPTRSFFSCTPLKWAGGMAAYCKYLTVETKIGLHHLEAVHLMKRARSIFETP